MIDKKVLLMHTLDADYWNNRYISNTIGWDLGAVSPPLKAYIDQVSDRNQAILIPGAGNAYEATYLADLGFTNITIIDFAPTVVAKLKIRTRHLPQLNNIEGDFFEHMGRYDLILEQTFFCALDPALRPQYITHMHELLQDGGILAGVLFGRYFEQAGPPFGGHADEYQELFRSKFEILKMEPCYNSVAARAGNELIFECRKI